MPDTSNKSQYERYAVQNAQFDTRIAELRLKEARREKAKAEFQANWYEHAPLSWLLRKTAIAFDGAMHSRLTKTSQHVPAYDTSVEVRVSDPATADEINALAASYQHSVSVRLVGPGPARRVFNRVAWLGYRVFRKTAKIILKPLMRR